MELCKEKKRLFAVCAFDYLVCHVLQILRCSKIASVKVAEIIALVQEALAEDSKQR